MSTIAGCALMASVIGLQIVGGPLYDVYGIRPDFPAIALATIALTLRPGAAIAVAILAGAALDISSAGVAGTHMTACLGLVFFILRGRKTGWDEDRAGRSLLSTGGILIAVLPPHLMSWALDGRPLNSAIRFAGTAGYTILFAWPLHRLLKPTLEWSVSPGQRPGLLLGRASWQRRA